MDVLLSILTGLLYAAGLYLLLHKGMMKMIIGIMMLGYASNLFLFLVAKLTRGVPALIPSAADTIEVPFADPVLQALILTAIVIGFGIQAFAIVLLKRVYQSTRTANMDDLNTTDKLDD